MFGRKPFSPFAGKGPWQSEQEPYRTPGFGDGINPALATSPADLGIPQDPYAGQRPEPPQQTGFFGKGGVGGFLGDILAFGPLALAARAKRSREDENDQRDFEQRMSIEKGRLRAQREAQDARMDIFGDAETGFYGRDGLGNISEVMKGIGRKDDPVIARLKAAGIDPSSERGQAAILNALPGYGNSEEVFERRRRLKQTTPGKAPSSSGGSGSTKLPTGYILD